MGTLHIHPKHPLFADGRQPDCPVCKAAILPMQAVRAVPTDDNTAVFILHESCALKMDYEGPPQETRPA